MAILERRRANTKGRGWSVEEDETLLDYLTHYNSDFKKLQALFPERSMASIRSKVRKVRITNDLFGASYRDTKGDFTTETALVIQPKIVFDAYAGAGHQAIRWIKFADTVYASEKVKLKLDQFSKTVNSIGFFEAKSDKEGWVLFINNLKKIYLFIGDAVEAAIRLASYRLQVSVVDLDTCGTTLPTLPTFLLLLKPQHVLITHGEFHAYRFRREDVLRRILCHRDISDLKEITSTEHLAFELDKAVKTSALRAHNETIHSMWPVLVNEQWLGGRNSGMLRRHYKITRPSATSDCINELSIPFVETKNVQVQNG
jgi:hypothetical protein